MWWMLGSKETHKAGTKRERGFEAEKLACRYLKKKGHRIITTNYTTKVGEIDIISSCRGVLVFTEVRSRKSREVFPEETIDDVKKGHIRRTAELYLQHKKEIPICRFDAIAVVFDETDVATITHYEDAF